MENENVVVEPKKKSPIGLVILIVVLMIGCFVGGYYLNERGNSAQNNEKTEEKDEKETEKETIVDEGPSEEYLEKVSRLVFMSNKTSVNVKNIKERLIPILVALSGKNITEVTGTELKELAVKYFDITYLEFVDQHCGMEKTETHDDVIYRYNSTTDKYEYNENHPGHGGSSTGIVSHLVTGTKSTEGEYFVYSRPVFYIYNGCVGDICGLTGIYDVYLTYEDVVNKTNKLFNALDNSDYCQNESCNDDKIYENIKDKVQTVYFYFKNSNGNYVFESYEIK